MSKQSLKLKKQKKCEPAQNKRQNLVDEKRRRERERQRLYRLTYPEFHFDTQHGEPQFVQVVRDALATISFEDRTIFARGSRSFIATSSGTEWAWSPSN